ncbi:MAG: c-type cytochrome [Candidatus Berkiellales bacterium]
MARKKPDWLSLTIFHGWYNLTVSLPNGYLIMRQLNKHQSFYILFCLLFISSQVWGKTLVGDPAAGKEKSTPCATCHGPDGNSAAPNWPKLAGQYSNYLAKQLKEYRLGEKGLRNNPVMAAQVANLSDQDIADLSAYYASLKQTSGKAKQQYVELGQRIYRGGNLETGVTACAACHGPAGEGNQAANFPRLAGQNAQYIVDQLRNFREGKRKNSPSDMMSSIGHRMSDEEIEAVSSYIEGLHPCKK